MIKSGEINRICLLVGRISLCGIFFIAFWLFSGQSLFSALCFLLSGVWLFYQDGKYFDSTLASLALIFPVSLSIGGSGVSVNYLFVALALILYVKNGFIVRHSFPMLCLVIFSFIFVLSVFWFGGEDVNFVRRAISFFLFISVFCFAFYVFGDTEIKGFKIAIILFTVCMTIDSLWAFFEIGGSSLGLSVKKIGSQRYSFIFIVGLFIAMMWNVKSIPFRSFKVSLVAFCGLGCLLSFSRSSIVGLLICLAVYLAFEWRSFFKIKPVVASVAVAIIGIAALNHWLPGTFDFYSKTLFSLVEADGVTPVFNLDNPRASEGYRLWLWGLIWDYSWANPFGSGFGGVWSIVEEGGSGSAHSQIFDVLFRSGIPGLAAFILLVWYVGNVLFKTHRDLFYGFLGMFIIGLFHETFKESHGAFLFAVFISIAVHHSYVKGRSEGNLYNQKWKIESD